MVMRRNRGRGLRLQLEMFSDEGRHLGVARPPTERSAQMRSAHEDRNLLARMIRAAPAGIASMVGRDHQKVVMIQTVHQLGKPAVELFERTCVAREVAAMAVKRVEIDEVRKKETSVRQAVATLQRAIEQRVVAV